MTIKTTIQHKLRNGEQVRVSASRTMPGRIYVYLSAYRSEDAYPPAEIAELFGTYRYVAQAEYAGCRCEIWEVR